MPVTATLLATPWRRRRILESWCATRPDDPARQVRLAFALTREAESLADFKQTDRALELLDRAVKIWSQLAVNSATVEHWREGLSESLWERARLLRTQGKSVDAEKLDGDREALWKGRARRARCIGRRGTQPCDGDWLRQDDCNADGTAVRQLGLDLAAANLRLALTMG